MALPDGWAQFGEGLDERCDARRLRQVVNGSRDVYVEADAEGRVTEWSVAAETMLGWTREEILGRSAASVFPSGHAGSVQRGIEVLKSMPPAFREAAVPDVFRVQLPLVASDGSTVMTLARIFAAGAEDAFRAARRSTSRARNRRGIGTVGAEWSGVRSSQKGLTSADVT